jgi:hypothetical protein
VLLQSNPARGCPVIIDWPVNRYLCCGRMLIVDWYKLRSTRQCDFCIKTHSRRSLQGLGAQIPPQKPHVKLWRLNHSLSVSY